MPSENQRAARQHFHHLIQLPEPTMPLAETALAIAWEDQDSPSPLAAALDELDRLAAHLRPRLADADSALEVVQTCNAYLFDELGFVGNSSNYGAPTNSFLDQVLHHRTGLPITLSIVYLEVGWRLHLPVSGVALPGHFLSRYAAPEGDMFIDPFRQGRLWSHAECIQQIQHVYAGATAAQLEQVMQPPTRRAIISRMLRNLKYSYIERETFERALATSERLLLLHPTDAEETRDRGLLRSKVNNLHGALEDLERYASLKPNAADLPKMQEYAEMLVQQLAAGN